MRPTEDKIKFVELRGSGRSIRDVCSEIGIGKNTALDWDKELSAEIARVKETQLQELYEMYYMTKEARIQRLGETLAKIDDALAQADLSEIPPEKLLDYKLKYTEALKEEYVAPATASKEELTNSTQIMGAIQGLLVRVQSGQITGSQAQREASIMGSLLKAYEAVEIEGKLALVQSAIGR